MSRLLFCIIFTLSSFTCISQEQFIEPAKFITKFSFRQFSGGVILVKGRLNNIKDSLTFILDTGSGAISLDSATCDEYKIGHKPSGKTLSGIAGRREVNYAPGNTLHLPGLSVKDLDFYINDYQVLTNVYGERIDGIIGYSFFSRYIVKINFDSLHLEVFRPGEIQYPRGGFLLKPFFTTLPIQPLRIKDANTILANFYYDTGAGLCVLMTQEFAKDSAVLMKKRKPVTIQAEGFGGKKQMQLTIVKEIKLGPYRFRRVPTHILDDEYNAISYPYLGGLIGNDLLKRFNQVINYGKREIHLLPNKNFNTPFDYSYTGLTFYYIDGKIIVDDVVKGSPAAKAGFMVDDVVVSVNNDFSNNIQTYKNIMQSANRPISVLLLREGRPKIIDFKVGRIR
jgi:hypothetical protein